MSTKNTTMNIVNKLFDERINAMNVLLQMSVKDYVSIGNSITAKNEFQRARVRRSSSVYQLLREDLKSGCLMPPIILAIKMEGMQGNSNPKNITDKQILSLVKKTDNLIILDGLQRTFTLIDLVEELKKPGDGSLDQFYARPLRVEVYLGLKKIGVLYRMLTLNTGQTPMSTRHQIEILYSDYLTKELEGIHFFTEANGQRVQTVGDYQFKDVVEGFLSYLDRDELGITRSELLENIQNLDNLSKENRDSDVFEEYITSHHSFVQRIDELSNHWQFNPDDCEPNKISGPFGKTCVDFFTKGIALSGYGAAIGKLKDKGVIKDFDDLKATIKQIRFDGAPDEAMCTFLVNLSHIKDNAKKIGSAQRLYFTYFFRELFNKEGDSFLVIEQAIDNGFKKYQYELG